MKNNTVYPEKGENKLNVTNVKLCFENLNSRTYKPGHLIVERQLSRESANSPLRKLAEFADVIVDACEVNESSKNGMTVYVNAVVSGEDKMQKLYEWLKVYAGEDKVEELAPGLMESLGLESNGDNSVASRFAKYRKLYEEEEAVSEDDDETSDETSDDETSDDKKLDDETSDDETSDEDKDSKDEDTEEDELTAVIIEVKKGDEDKAKDELIEAGVDEDDIEILENDEESSDEDEDEKSDDDANEDEEETSDDDKEETVKIKIAVDSFDALKEYLEGKGFDLEAELGGEIVTGDEDDDKDSDDDSDDELADEFAGFDDLFADEPEEDDKSK